MSGERGVTFECSGEQLLGILHTPATEASLGILIVVGGPQYRVGSHRQFLLLARSWSDAGIPVLRFDCRGMGDSEGKFPGFESIEPDIASAIDAFIEQVPWVRRIVLWGLCDAATAISFYIAQHDERVAGVVLVNPWVRSQVSAARTQLKHYYWSRLADVEFWQKLRHGKFDLRTSIREFGSTVRKVLGAKLKADSVADGVTASTLIEEMGMGLLDFDGPALLILSGRDLTAKEFADAAGGSKRWRKLLNESRVTRHDLPDADHTFSRRIWREEIARLTKEWIGAIDV